VVKAHPKHPHTSDLVAEAITRAAQKSGMPEGVFLHVHGEVEEGQALVKHPLTKAIGFTGSFRGGKALYDLAQQRPEPIPVFAEMSSINPVVILPEIMKQQGEAIANTLAQSMLLGAGQFCTSPGLVIGVEGKEMDAWMLHFTKLVNQAPEQAMLNEDIAQNFRLTARHLLEQVGVKRFSDRLPNDSGVMGIPLVSSVSGRDFMANEQLQEEVFGSSTLLVTCANLHDVKEVVGRIRGQLTATVWGEEQEIAETEIIELLSERAGRIIINGVPTGVEVCAAQMHGGPFPATTDARFTAVGPDAIYRFLRPLAFQNFPNSLLPDCLKR
jgi:2,5-dioxopentanoate dehydrogenase